MDMTPPEWPARLKLRDAKVMVDEGQRIYTTATGYGYEECIYVRADIADDILQMLKVAQLWLDVDGRFDMQGINAAITKAEAGRLHPTSGGAQRLDSRENGHE